LKSRQSYRISGFPDTRKDFSPKFNTECTPLGAAFQARRRPNVAVVGGQLKMFGFSENVYLPARASTVVLFRLMAPVTTVIGKIEEVGGHSLKRGEADSLGILPPAIFY
jgi:hypothetical protein